MPEKLALSAPLPVEHPTGSVADPDATIGADTPAAALSASTAGGRYVLGEEIARGGMGAVYRAIDTAFGREVAVKVLLEKYAPDSGAARRFQDEARITGQLQHPGIPPAHDLGTLPNGEPFLAMKLIKGDTLDNLLKQRSDPAADRGRLVAVFEGVCQAVAYAHAHGVVHRDLKPSNVMVGAFGEVQLMDWGLAKVLGDGRSPPTDAPDADAAGTAVRSTRDSDDFLTEAGSVLGTPAYMPPEQAIGAVHEVDRRSDVFGLGGILAVVLTGRPPFVGDSAETTRVQSARGEVQGCYERLDACGADPGLVALAKRCLAPKREDRPADAEVVAAEVALLRSAADDRARQAEVELAADAAADAERRKRRRVWIGAAAALATAVLGGLGAVLAVQRRSNADLAAANGALAAKNEALEAERAKVERRFEMARKAIAAFHTTIDAEPELGDEAFRPLRRKLLTAAAGFYRELEGVLARETDPKSRMALAEGYFQLAQLSAKIGDKTEALGVYRKALAIRRELAEASRADVKGRQAVSETLLRVGWVLADTGDPAGAMRAYEEARDLAMTAEAEAPSDAVRLVLAASHFGIGVVFRDMGRPDEALEAHAKARDLRRKLVEANPSDAVYQGKLADSHNNIGNLLKQKGKPVEALAAHQAARDLRQKLADAHPADPGYQSDLAQSHDNIGILLKRTGKAGEALAAHQTAREIRRRLADAHPAFTQYRSDLADSHLNTGIALDEADRPDEALAEFQNAHDLYRKLADAHPTVPQFQNDLANNHDSIGIVLDKTSRTDEALAAFETARELRRKLAEAHPAVPGYRSALAANHEKFAAFLSRKGKPFEALAALEEARSLRQLLADAHPTVTRYQSELAVSHREVGEMRGRLDEPKEALAAFERARDVHRKLVEAHPAVPEYRAELAGANNLIGRLLAKGGRFTEALAALDAGLGILEDLVATDATTMKYSNALALNHACRGWVRSRAGKPYAADLRKAGDLWADGIAPDLETRFEQARAKALLAKLGTEPKSGVTADEARKFADQAAAILADAVKAGWTRSAELREPDFDAIRDRADFRKLQAEVEAVDRPAPAPATGRR